LRESKTQSFLNTEVLKKQKRKDFTFPYAYPIDSEYGKFTIHYVMKIPTGVVPFAIGNAITFREGGANLPVYRVVEQYVRQKAEEYNDAVLTRIFIRIYYSDMKSSVPRYLSEEEIASQLVDCCMESEAEAEPIEVRKIENRKREYPKHITALKPGRGERSMFRSSPGGTTELADLLY
jgi:hypothetical protein